MRVISGINLDLIRLKVKIIFQNNCEKKLREN